MVQALPTSSGAPVLPTLETGDRLAREEFHRRYLLRPDLGKVELINGVVYVASPTRIPEHSAPHLILAEPLAAYRRTHADVRGGAEGTLILMDEQELRPDLFLRYTRKAGGRSWIDAGHYLRGAPELIAEIAASSASYDLTDKRELYRQAGVQEYLVWRVEDEAIDWWQLVGGDYEPLAPDASGAVASRVFPGLILDIPALLQTARESED
jgi:Uma2 family endonuclease